MENVPDEDWLAACAPSTSAFTVIGSVSALTEPATVTVEPVWIL
jgi:hypothetical protein